MTAMPCDTQVYAINNGPIREIDTGNLVMLESIATYYNQPKRDGLEDTEQFRNRLRYDIYRKLQAPQHIIDAAGVRCQEHVARLQAERDRALAQVYAAQNANANGLGQMGQMGQDWSQWQAAQAANTYNAGLYNAQAIQQAYGAQAPTAQMRPPTPSKSRAKPKKTAPPKTTGVVSEGGIHSVVIDGVAVFKSEDEGKAKEMAEKLGAIGEGMQAAMGFSVSDEGIASSDTGTSFSSTTIRETLMPGLKSLRY
jgi:hypothetical protein